MLPKGWRPLEPFEPVQAGDMYWTGGTKGCWKDVTTHHIEEFYLEPFDKYSFIRRKKKQQWRSIDDP